MAKPSWIAKIAKVIGEFTDLEPDSHIYVPADYQRRGVASALLHHVETAAREVGITRLFSEISITAWPFFERQGFIVLAAQVVSIRDQELVNYKMDKHLKVQARSN